MERENEDTKRNPKNGNHKKQNTKRNHTISSFILNWSQQIYPLLFSVIGKENSSWMMTIPFRQTYMEYKYGSVYH